MRRREAMLAALALGLATGRRSEARVPLLEPADWEFFKENFITADGRVRDTGNRGISHSESQGYGMLLAAAVEDEADFRKLWAWTQANLGVRGDGLFAWKYDVGSHPDPVADRNNASDGDILIAWALARAARLWGDAGLGAVAATIARATREHLVLPTSEGPMLLPGSQGFVHDGRLTVNPSYWVFPAIPTLHELDPDPAWPALAESGRQLLVTSRFGPAGLPPDWLELSRPPMPSPRFPAEFGWNAVRIPLHLIWAGHTDAEILAPFGAIWTEPDAPRSATVRLADASWGKDPPSTGIRAIAELTRAAMAGRRPLLPSPGPGDDYYSTALLLLTKIAAQEMPLS